MEEVQEYALIRRVEGAEHKPNNGRPWQFQHGGAWHTLEDAHGKPKPFPIAMAQVALQFFTPSDARGAGDPLVELDIRQGSLGFGSPAAPVLEDPETGETYSSVAEFIAAIKERGAAEAAARMAPLQMSAADLEAMEPADLRELAKNRGLTVAGNASKATLIKALLPGG